MHVAECAKPVVDGDDDHGAALREVVTVVDGRRARAHQEAAAVDPDEDGPPRGVEARRPDVEREAVFARRHAGGAQPAEPGQCVLRRGRARAERLLGARPGLRRRRRPEAQRAQRRARKANPAEDANPRHFPASDPSEARLDLGVHGHRFVSSSLPRPAAGSLTRGWPTDIGSSQLWARPGKMSSMTQSRTPSRRSARAGALRERRRTSGEPP